MNIEKQQEASLSCSELEEVSYCSNSMKITAIGRHHRGRRSLSWEEAGFTGEAC